MSFYISALLGLTSWFVCVFFINKYKYHVPLIMFSTNAASPHICTYDLHLSTQSHILISVCSLHAVIF